MLSETTTTQMFLCHAKDAVALSCQRVCRSTSKVAREEQLLQPRQSQISKPTSLLSSQRHSYATFAGESLEPRVWLSISRAARRSGRLSATPSGGLQLRHRGNGGRSTTPRPTRKESGASGLRASVWGAARPERETWSLSSRSTRTLATTFPC